VGRLAAARAPARVSTGKAIQAGLAAMAGGQAWLQETVESAARVGMVRQATRLISAAACGTCPRAT
jgi:hypothetical protein